MLGVHMDDVGHFYQYVMHVLFCISWHAMTPVIFSLKLNLNITQLEYTVDWVMVPLNRVSFQCNHICLCGKALIRSIDTASSRCLHLGKIMSCLPWPGKHT